MVRDKDLQLWKGQMNVHGPCCFGREICQLKLCYKNILQKKGRKVLTINVTKLTKPSQPTSLFFALSTRSTPRRPPLNSSPSPYQSFTVPYCHMHHLLLVFHGPHFLYKPLLVHLPKQPHNIFRVTFTTIRELDSLHTPP